MPRLVVSQEIYADPRRFRVRKSVEGGHKATKNGNPFSIKLYASRREKPE